MDLIEAVQKNNIQFLHKLLKKGPNSNVNVDFQDKFGWTALIEASWRGHTECVRLLLHAGANRDLRTKDGLTALMEASAKGRTECLRLLLDNTTNPDLQDKWHQDMVVQNVYVYYYRLVQKQIYKIILVGLH